MSAVCEITIFYRKTSASTRLSSLALTIAQNYWSQRLKQNWGFRVIAHKRRAWAIADRKIFGVAKMVMPGHSLLSRTKSIELVSLANGNATFKFAAGGANRARRISWNSGWRPIVEIKNKAGDWGDLQTFCGFVIQFILIIVLFLSFNNYNFDKVENWSNLQERTRYLRKLQCL